MSKDALIAMLQKKGRMAWRCLASRPALSATAATLPARSMQGLHLGMTMSATSEGQSWAGSTT